MSQAQAKAALFAALATFALAAWGSVPAHAAFGLSELSVAFTEADGTPARRAGSHPFAMTTSFRVNSREHPIKKVPVVDGAIRNLDVILPEGFAGNPTAVPRCQTLDFLASNIRGHSSCSDATAVGVLTAKVGGGTGIEGEETVPVYSLLPSPGVAAKLGFWVADLPIAVDVTPATAHPYNVTARLANTSQIAEVLSSVFTIWGSPSDPRHDPDRGECAYEGFAGSCEAKIPPKPLVLLPRSCSGPLKTIVRALSWWSGDPVHPGPPESFDAVVESPGLIGCSALSFSPRLAVRLSTDRTESASGLEADLRVEDEGVSDPGGIAQSDITDAVLALPEGVTANPSLAEGLATCSAADLARETLSSEPGDGCPQASKVGTLLATTPILEGAVLKGALFIAPQEDPTTSQSENPFSSLLALHMVVKDPALGILIKQSGKIEPNPRTGQLITTFSDLPPFPLGEVTIRLREGGRSPLISPPACGSYSSLATLTPSGDPASPLASPSSFQITSGVGGGPCPPPGAPPFDPGFGAGTLSNDAASFSPFHMHLTRRDADQDLTRFDATLAPGVLAKLAGVGKCPDEAIEQAKQKTGRTELAQPSCPSESQIGIAIGGAGVGSQLTYAKGKLYMAGPVKGAPLSVVGIVPAVAGPFDVGTVVVRQALRVNPITGRAEVDGGASDPIPHILAGIPLKVKDIRVEVDRPRFTLNPTGCEATATVAQIWGGGADVFSAADDAPVTRSARFQAANCSDLGFRPRLGISLRGATGRGGHPALASYYRPRRGDANLDGLALRLPRSAFLEQAHIRTICTRVQFAKDACPKGAIYGHVTATTPLLEEPLRGPVYLRSSNNELPDLVFDLHGLVDVEVSARIDSVRGGIRATFENVPDAPITRVVVAMQGGRKGLIVNSRSLCDGKARAQAELRAQSGKKRSMRPLVGAVGCGREKGRGGSDSRR